MQCNNASSISEICGYSRSRRPILFITDIGEVALCEACECKDEGRAPLFERDELAASFESILGGDVDSLARLLDSFRHALDEGLCGINEARAALVTAVELVYLRTSAHASALRLYRLSLEGYVIARRRAGWVAQRSDHAQRAERICNPLRATSFRVLWFVSLRVN